jgi:hypothetical protein
MAMKTSKPKNPQPLIKGPLKEISPSEFKAGFNAYMREYMKKYRAKKRAESMRKKP